MIAALLLLFGWWMVFALCGDNSKLTSSQVALRCLLAMTLIAGGCGKIAWDVWQALQS